MSSPGIRTANSRPEPCELVEVAQQRLAGPGVLHLDRDRTAVVPDRLVHLADGGRRGGPVGELREQRAPVLTQPFGQDPVHGVRGQGRRRLLQPGERRAVRPGDLRRQRGLEDRQHLAELHRPALELAEHLEELLGGALLDLQRDQLGGLAERALAHAEGRTSGESDGEGGELGGPCHGATGEIAHELSFTGGVTQRACLLIRALRSLIRLPARSRIREAAGAVGPIGSRLSLCGRDATRPYRDRPHVHSFRSRA